MTTIGLTDKNPQFVPPKQPELNTDVPSILSQRYDRMVKSYERGHITYVSDQIDPSKPDSTEKMNQHFIKNNPPECTRYSLISMTRVLLPPARGNSECYFEGPAPDYKPVPEQRTALIVKVQVKVLNPDSVARGVYTDILSHCSYTLGRYPQLIPRISYNHRGQIINSEIGGHRDVYFIKDTPEEIDNMIGLFGQPLKKCKVAEAPPMGKIHETRTVPNFDEWKTEPIELLISANKKSLLGSIAGGTKLFKQFEDVMRKLVNEGVYPQQKFDNITRQEILDLIEKHGNSGSKDTKKGKQAK